MFHTNSAQVFLKRNQVERYLQLASQKKFSLKFMAVTSYSCLQLTNVSITELFHNIWVAIANFFQLCLAKLSSLSRQQASYISEQLFSKKNMSYQKILVSSSSAVFIFVTIIHHASMSLAGKSISEKNIPVLVEILHIWLKHPICRHKFDVVIKCLISQEIILYLKLEIRFQ